MNSAIKVQKIRRPDPVEPTVRLGEGALSHEIASKLLLRALAKNPDGVFQLSWTGDKVPRGAVVGRYEIDWTQNGTVQTKAGEMVGTYERIVEFGGPGRNQHVMNVYLF